MELSRFGEVIAAAATGLNVRRVSS